MYIKHLLNLHSGNHCQWPGTHC